MAESIFEPADEGVYIATDAALSPWTDQALHGGPPAMLMAREIERFPSDQNMFVARLSIELLRPIGRLPLSVRCRLVRPGRKVQLVESSIWSDGIEVARATGLRMRSAEIEVPQENEPLPHGPPESLTEWSGSWARGPAYHLLGVEVRAPENSDRSRGPGWAWFRLKLPLLPGEEASGLLRICAAADFPNGISYVVDPRKIMFVNPDITIHVQKLPADEWVMVDARTWLEPRGTGLAEGTLYDRHGRIGRSVQSLFVEPR
jgi:hypothetical protein